MYEDRPFSDHHRYHRPAALVAAAANGQIAGRGMDDMLDWLDYQTPASAKYPKAFLDSMKALGVQPPRRRRG